MLFKAFDDGCAATRSATEPECEMECAAPALFAFQPELSAHQLHQARANGKSQTGTTELPCHGGIRLAEGLKYQGLLVFGYANARIPHAEVQQGGILRAGFNRNRDQNLATAGKLHRVSSQIRNK